MDRFATPLVLLIAALWIVITVFGWIGLWLPGMLLGIVLMLAHMYLGASHKGKLDGRFWLYPFLPWVVLWTLSFILSAYFGKKYAGGMPEFTIFGLHPSFAWTVLTYWIGGVVTITLGFIARRSLWLSDEAWEEFKADIKRLNAQEQGGTTK